MKISKITTVLFVLLAAFLLTACGPKKRCAVCGRTEKEAHLSEFQSKYYCSVHYRDVVSSQKVSPEVSREIDRVLETTGSSADHS